MVPVLLLLLAALPQEDCRSERLEPADTPFEEVFGPGVADRALELWEPSWGRTYARVFVNEELESRAVVYSEAADSGSRATLEALFAESAPLSAEANWRVSLADGPEPEIRLVEDFARCRPTLSNRDTLVELLRVLGREVDFDGRQTAVFRVRVLPTGAVDDVRTERVTGNPELDARLRDAAWRMAFEPGRIEGIPVTVWVQIPLTVRQAR